MIGVMKRSAVPVFLLLLGIATFVYGMNFHDLQVTQDVEKTIQVMQRREVERTVPIFDPFRPLPGDPGVPPMDPMPMDPMQPPMHETFIEIVEVPVSKNVTQPQTKTEPEGIVVWEATLGGLRLESGRLQRTYPLIMTEDGKVSPKSGPPGCPT